MTISIMIANLINASNHNKKNKGMFQTHLLFNKNKTPKQSNQ